MPRYRVEIDDTNTVRIWDEENPNEFNAPFILQPIHPDGRPWINRVEAQDWLDNFLEEMNTPAPVAE